MLIHAQLNRNCRLTKFCHSDTNISLSAFPVSNLKLEVWSLISNGARVRINGVQCAICTSFC